MRKKVLAAWFAVLSCFSVGAQVNLTPEVQEAVQLALGKDVEVKNQHLELQRMELERKSVLSKYIPKVEANALYVHFNTEMTLDVPTVNLPIGNTQLFQGSTTVPNHGNAFHGGVMAKAVLFSGGQIYNGAKALEQKNQGTALMMDNRADDVIKSVIEGYDQLQLLRQAEHLIDESEKRLTKEQERVEKAIAAGLAVPYDRDKIKLATLELESKRADVHHKQELLALKIAQETGMDKERILSAPHQVQPILVTGELHTENRNELKALESFKKASEYAVKKEKGSFLPTLGAFGGYSYTSLFDAQATLPLSALNTSAQLNMNRLTLNPTWMVGVGLKWEIFSGFERKHKVDEAKLGLAQVENTLQDTREKLDLQLQKNKIEYENMLNQVQIATQKEQIAQNNNVLAEKQYMAGLITITERLSAENDLYEAALQKIDAIIHQRQSAIATYQSIGPLSSFITIE